MRHAGVDEISVLLSDGHACACVHFAFLSPELPRTVRESKTRLLAVDAALHRRRGPAYQPHGPSSEASPSAVAVVVDPAAVVAAAVCTLHENGGRGAGADPRAATSCYEKPFLEPGASHAAFSKTLLCRPGSSAITDHIHARESESERLRE